MFYKKFQFFIKIPQLIKIMIGPNPYKDNASLLY